MPDTTIRDGFECCQDGGYRTSRCPYCRYTMERPPCVVVTGRTAQDVTRLLREPTDEDIERAAIALYVFDFDSWELESDGMRDHYRWWARKAIAAYRSPEEADRA
jgi:hypothetical protein